MMLYFDHYWDISETIEDKLTHANQSKHLLDASKTTPKSPSPSPPTIDNDTTTTTTTSPLITAAKERPKLEREKSNNSISSNNSNNTNNNNLISPEVKPVSRLPASIVKKAYNSIPSEEPPIEYDSTETGSVLTEEQVIPPHFLF